MLPLKNHSWLIHTIPVIIILIIFIFPLCGAGLIVGGDWTSPFTNKQLIEYSKFGSSIWTNREIPTGTQISHQNTYPNNIFAGVLASTGLSGVNFEKMTIFLTLLGMYIFSYLFFIRITKNKLASSIAALTYLISPLVFNYLNMGWNFVILYLALAPLFTLICIDYLKTGGKRDAICLGLISAVGFMQSQAIVWFPIIYFLVFLNQLELVNFSRKIFRFIVGIFTMASSVIIIHAPWIVTSLYYLDISFKSTSVIDLNRFSVVFSLLRSFADWGSLYNEQFEVSYPTSLVLFSLFPILLIIYSAIQTKKEDISKYYYFAISLILIAPLIYIFRGEIMKIPFSSIIRDSSRFLVFTSFGISTGIALSLSMVKNKTLFLATIIPLILTSYPFFSGRLYSSFESDHSIMKYNGQDFRLRLLDIPMGSIDNEIAGYSSSTNILFPTGGLVQTINDKRFKEDFWSISDTQAYFSPYVTGIYISDKSNPLVMNLARTLSDTEDSLQNIEKILGIYGIKNNFNRSNLRSTINISAEQASVNPSCDQITNSNLDWSITQICHIKDTYPLIYSSIQPIYSTKLMSEIVEKIYSLDKQIAVIGCPKSIDTLGIACGPSKPYQIKTNKMPTIRVTTISSTKFIVDINEMNGSFLLVLNKTFHQGWRIFNKDGVVMNFDHLLINQLVNGWLINPSGDETSGQYIIEFYPQKIYSDLYPISVTIFLVLSLYVCLGLFRKK